MLPETQGLATSVLVADDNPATLAAVAQFLTEEHYRVVGAVPDGGKLIAEAMELKPDVAVVDIFMPTINGLEAVAELSRMHCGTKFIMLTAANQPEFTRAALKAGASAYVLKNHLVTDLPIAIESALRGEKFLSPTLADSSRHS